MDSDGLGRQIESLDYEDEEERLLPRNGNGGEEAILPGRFGW